MGPTTSRLAEVAKRRKTYIIAGLFEREANTLYNSSVHNNHYAHIIDPAGEMVAESSVSGRPAIATIDLNHRYTDPWLGDMKERFMKEIRFDVRVPQV